MQARNRRRFTLIILEREDKKGRKVIHAFATSVSVDVVCGFKRDQMTGAEAVCRAVSGQMLNRDRVQVYRVHEAQNHQQGRVRTRAAAIHAHPFVQRVDSGIVSAAKSQLWQSRDRDDV